MRPIRPLYVLLVAACGSSNQQLDQSNAATTEDAAAQEKLSQPDLSRLDVCQLVSAREVASTLGAVVLRSGRTAAGGRHDVGCEYEVDPAGEDGSETAVIRVAPESSFPGAEAELEAARALRQRASTELITGLGDESYIIHNETEQQVFIQVRRGNFFISVRAEEVVRAKRLARLALARL